MIRRRLREQRSSVTYEINPPCGFRRFVRAFPFLGTPVTRSSPHSSGMIIEGARLGESSDVLWNIYDIFCMCAPERERERGGEGEIYICNTRNLSASAASLISSLYILPTFFLSPPCRVLFLRLKIRPASRGVYVQG